MDQTIIRADALLLNRPLFRAVIGTFSVAIFTCILVLITATRGIGQIERDIHKKYILTPQYRIEEIYKAETDLRKRWKQGPYAASYFRQIPKSNITITKKAKGDFILDNKTGNWHIKEDILHYSIDSVVGYKPHGHFDGHKKTWIYGYEEGQPDSIWTYRHKVIEKDSVKTVLIEGKIFWQKDSLLFESNERSNRYKVKGQFTNDGFMHGVWTMEYLQQGVKVEEQRQYSDGFLVGYSLRDLSTQTLFEEVDFPAVLRHMEKWLNLDHTGKQEIAVDTVPLRHINAFLFDPIHKEDMSRGDSAILFFSSQMLAAIDFDSLYVEVIDQNQFFKTRVLKKALNQTDFNNLKNLQNERIPGLINRIDRFLSEDIYITNIDNNNALNVEVENLNFLSKRLSGIQESLNWLFSDTFQYVNFSQFDIYELDHIDQEIPWQVSTGNDITTEFRYMNQDTSSSYELSRTLDHYINQLEQLMTTSFQKMDRVRIDIKKREELSTFSAKLKNRQAEINSSFEEALSFNEEGAIQGHPNQPVYKYAYNEFLQYQLVEMMTAFDQTPGYNSAINLYQDINNYIDSLAQIKGSLDIIHNKSKATADWFDYGSLKEERHFKHIYEKGLFLWDHFSENAQSSKTLISFNYHLQQLKELKAVMHKIKDNPGKQQKRLNKALKRTDDITEIKQLFGIE